MSESSTTRNGKLIQAAIPLRNLNYTYYPSDSNLKDEEVWIDATDDGERDENDVKAVEISVYTLGTPLFQVEPSPAPPEEGDEMEEGTRFTFIVPSEKRAQFAEYLREVAYMIDSNDE